MTTQVRFEMPDWVEGADFEKYFAENMEGYAAALDKSANPHDDRSQVDGVPVRGVDLHPDSVTIHYQVEISAYHGCQDVNYAETDERYLTGRRQGRVFIFDQYVYPAPRTSFEEF